MKKEIERGDKVLIARCPVRGHRGTIPGCSRCDLVGRVVTVTAGHDGYYPVWNGERVYLFKTAQLRLLEKGAKKR